MASLATDKTTDTSTTTTTTTTTTTAAAETKADPIFDEQEQQAIVAIRGILTPLYPATDPAAKFLDDTTLWRYLVAREFDMDKTKAMFVDSMQWKKTIALHQLLEEYKQQQVTWSRISQRVFYAGLLPVHVENSRGGPVAIERLGMLDLGGLYRHTEECDYAINGYCTYLESIWQRLHARHQGTKTQALIIGDCTGLSLGFLWYINTFKKIIDIGPKNYPEATYKVIMVNAPSAVTAIWTVVSAFLPARTKEKVQILGRCCCCWKTIGGWLFVCFVVLVVFLTHVFNFLFFHFGTQEQIF